MLAHEDGGVRVVVEIAGEPRKLVDDFLGDVGMPLGRDEDPEPGRAEKGGDERQGVPPNRGLRRAPRAEDRNRGLRERPAPRRRLSGSGRWRAACARPASPKLRSPRHSRGRPAWTNDPLGPPILALRPTVADLEEEQRSLALGRTSKWCRPERGTRRHTVWQHPLRRIPGTGSSRLSLQGGGSQGGLGGSPEPISAPRRSGSQSRRHRSRLRQAGKGRADPGHGKRETAELPRVEWARPRSKSSRAPALPERNDRPRGARSPPHICRLTPRRRGPHPHRKPASGACSPNTTPSKRKGRSGVSVTKSR